MDLDNLGPIVLFIVYMAISAWSKQNKARQKAKPLDKSGAQAPRPQSKPAQAVGGILEQLKKELFEIDESPLAFQQVIPEYDEDEIEEEELPEPIAAEPVSQYTEGSPKHKMEHPLLRVVKFEEHRSAGQSLEEILEPYSRLEQGIILQELLGKPKARQRNDEWFHKS